MLHEFSEKYGFATPEEKEALAIAYSLWGGYIGEVDGVENRNGTIPGYEVKEANTNQFIIIAENLVNLAKNIIKKLITFVYPIFGK